MSYNSPPPPPPPPGPAGQPMGMQPKPNNNLVWAILTTLFCCLPFGIVAIVYASKVDTHYASGQYAEAQRASASAKTWSIWAAVIGALVIAGYLVVIVLFGALAGSGAYYGRG